VYETSGGVHHSGCTHIDPDLPTSPPPSSPTDIPLVPSNLDAPEPHIWRIDPYTGWNSRGVERTRVQRQQSAMIRSFFWVPAGLHPEIAPAELSLVPKEHCQIPSGSEPPVARMRRSRDSKGNQLRHRYSAAFCHWPVIGRMGAAVRGIPSLPPHDAAG